MTFNLVAVKSTMLPASLSQSYINYDWIAPTVTESSEPFLINKHSYVIQSQPPLSSLPTRNHFQLAEAKQQQVLFFSYLREYAEYHKRISSIYVPETNLWINLVKLERDGSMFFFFRSHVYSLCVEDPTSLFSPMEGVYTPLDQDFGLEVVDLTEKNIRMVPITPHKKKARAGEVC